ncbi:hypothetical protein [uncultured Rhodoferax sp.]|uniref:hypothetical protein n=1 Tax=uncultured Rhodoferax sp. TaxID=223188 RepID=UPI0025EDB95A|nr:hypothetical protein [uncultured Rhodoferax sp.]
MRFLLYVFCLLALFGCASSSVTYRDAPSVDGNTATIYIYRPQKFLLGAYDARLAIDGENAIKLGGGAYTYVRVSEGCHRIELSWPYGASLGHKADLDVCVQGQDSRYVRIEGLNVVSWRLQLIGRTEALPEISTATYEPAGGASK